MEPESAPAIAESGSGRPPRASPWAAKGEALSSRTSTASVSQWPVVRWDVATGSGRGVAGRGSMTTPDVSTACRRRAASSVFLPLSSSSRRLRCVLSSSIFMPVLVSASVNTRFCLHVACGRLSVLFKLTDVVSRKLMQQHA